MPTSIEEIEELIQKDVQNRTFSLEAIEAIGGIRKELESQSDEIKRRKKTETDNHKEIGKLNLEVSSQNDAIGKLKEKIHKFDEREAIHHKQDTALAVAEATKTLAVDMAMGLVRNTTYKSAMFGNGPTNPPSTDQYGNQQHGSSSVNEETSKTAE